MIRLFPKFATPSRDTLSKVVVHAIGYGRRALTCIGRHYELSTIVYMYNLVAVLGRGGVAHVAFSLFNSKKIAVQPKGYRVSVGKRGVALYLIARSYLLKTHAQR